MLFQSADYFLFLTIAVAAFWLLARHHRVRVALLFVLSCAFYMAWKPEYIVLILGSTLLDFAAGNRIHTSEGKVERKLWLAASLSGNLGLLFAFKYYNFFALELSQTIEWMGGSASLPLLEAALPVGISFYTFQTLSYTIDIYRGKLEPTRDLFEFAAFVTYFPQLVAGPIVRASELLPQLSRPPSVDSDRISQGLFLILTGLVKKVALADYLALNCVDRMFDQPELFSGVEVVVALYAFTMQLYLDFSGYTDVARGSAMLMGFELPANFDRPYQATNPADFWRRWHMTLSRWLRDYLYFPLGGSRVGPVRAYFNLGLTMFLVGIWHGWWGNFEVFFWYALLQTFAMVGHRFVYRFFGRSRDAVDAPHITALKVFANLQFVVFSRILFRASSMENAEDVGGRITRSASTLWRHWTGPEALEESQLALATSTLHISVGVWLILLFTFAAHYTPKKIFQSFETFFVKLPPPAQGLMVAIVAGLLSLVAATEAVPYIYFQF
jgi:D-alanyl-lipoteichoic acid acyltransferase DltB (MBOAT superfamily)